MATSPRVAAAKSVAAESAEKQPYMSEYDKSVELRLQVLESRTSVSHQTTSAAGVDEDRLAALEAKVDDLIDRLARKMSF